MTGRTHAAVSLAASAWLGYLPPLRAAPDSGLMSLGVATMAVLGGLLPDVDEPSSTLGREIPGGRVGRLLLGAAAAMVGIRYKSFVALLVGVGLAALALVPHRGVTHSLAALVAVGLAAHSLPAVYLRPLLAGYASQLLLDALTPEGVPLLWPLRIRIGLPLVRTGGLLDKMFLWLALVGFATIEWRLL